FNAAVGAGDSGSDGLLDLVCQRRCHFAQCAPTVDVRKICLQLTQFLAFLFCTFPIFNVREGSVPINNVSTLAPKWDTTHQKPSIIALSGATEPRLAFEGSPGHNGDAPIFGMVSKIFGMNRTLPTCA